MPIKDTARTLALLEIVERVSKVSPGFVHLSGDAMAELREIEENIRKTKLAEQNLPVTPPPVPGGSTPTDTPVDAKSPIPPRPVRNVDADGMPGPAEAAEPIPPAAQPRAIPSTPDQPELPNIDRRM
jgi:hypothetical protein